LLEGPMSEDSVNLLATKVLASGLRTTTELPDADTLQFLIAIGYMAQPVRASSVITQEYLDRMLREVTDMRNSSRKAIRLVAL